MFFLHFFTFHNYLIFSIVFFLIPGKNRVDFQSCVDLCFLTIYRYQESSFKVTYHVFKQLSNIT